MYKDLVMSQNSYKVIFALQTLQVLTFLHGTISSCGWIHTYMQGFSKHKMGFCCSHAVFTWVCDIWLNNAVSSLWSFLWFYGQQPRICVKVFCRFYIIILFLYILLLRGKTFWRFFIVFRHRLLFHSFSVLSLYLTILLSYLTMTDKSFKHKTAPELKRWTSVVSPQKTQYLSVCY